MTTPNPAPRVEPILRDGDVVDRLKQFRLRWHDSGDLTYLGKALTDAVVEIEALRKAASPATASEVDAVARREAAMLVMEMAEDRDPDNVAEMFRIYENAPHDCEERTGVRKPYGCGRCDVERAYAAADRIRSALSPAATSGSEAGGEAAATCNQNLADAHSKNPPEAEHV